MENKITGQVIYLGYDGEGEVVKGLWEKLSKDNEYFNAKLLWGSPGTMMSGDEFITSPINTESEQLVSKIDNLSNYLEEYIKCNS